MLAGLEELGVANFPTYRNLLSTATRSKEVISEFWTISLKPFSSS